MQKLALSTNIDRLTTEIKTYQTIGGQAIFEIGRRLKWVKDNDLAHGEFGNWLETIQMDKSQASRFIKVATEIDESKLRSGAKIGLKALYEIATMPESERDKPQQLDSGETKRPDEMTVRELRETKKKLKERDSQIEELKNQPPKVVEKEVKVETVPDDYDYLKGIVENSKSLSEHYKQENKKLRDELDELETKRNDQDGLAENKARLIEEIASLDAVKDLGEKVNEFLQSVSTVNYSANFNSLSNDRDSLGMVLDAISSLENWCQRTKDDVQKQNFIEGDISNE